MTRLVIEPEIIGDCPFCSMQTGYGEEDGIPYIALTVDIAKDITEDRWYVKCNHCGGSGSIMSKPEDALDAWANATG